jgi:hypothetical protein
MGFLAGWKNIDSFVFLGCSSVFQPTFTFPACKWWFFGEFPASSLFFAIL